MEGLNLLTDPQWSDRASPMSWIGPRRYAAPGIRFEDLPRIDLVVLSHDHYDHMDRATLVRLHEAHHPIFCVPRGDAIRLTGWGITHVQEMDWWDHTTVGNASITCVPAQHFSGRTPWDRNSTLWAGWVIQDGKRKFYFAGDTGYGPMFSEIGARCGPFDLAAIPIGAYDPPGFMQPIHLNPEEALRAHEESRSRQSLAIHWGTFKLTLEPQNEPPTRLREAMAACGVPDDRFWVLRPGETRTVPHPGEEPGR
jgi:N-acyl-phosphatidylethanolamine-hydrolysing phospholipase D